MLYCRWHEVSKCITDLLIPQSWKWRKSALILSMTRMPIQLDSVQTGSIFAKVALLKADSIFMVQVQAKNICSKTGTGVLTAFCAAKGVSLSSWYLDSWTLQSPWMKAESTILCTIVSDYTPSSVSIAGSYPKSEATYLVMGYLPVVFSLGGSYGRAMNVQHLSLQPVKMDLAHAKMLQNQTRGQSRN